jgi:AraC-like DNA-binding protein
VSLVTAWRPAVAGIVEVFHARYVDHAYPMHTHDAWTLLLVDAGAVRYDLDRRGRSHGALPAALTLLPPGVAHDGRAATAHGFRKRVLYLDDSVLGPDLVGAAVDAPSITDDPLLRRVAALHGALAHPGDALEAESRLALIAQRLRDHLRPRGTAPGPRGTAPGPRGTVPGPPAARKIADAFRDLLDARTVPGVTLAEAAAILHAHPTHLVRAFRDAFGLPPHAYLTGRRVERARALLLEGRRPADVAAAAGFYDQSHLTRYFKRYLGTAPATYPSAVPAGSGSTRPAASRSPGGSPASWPG